MDRVDRELLDGLSQGARSRPRGRLNHNFHDSLDDPCHRFLNAIEPGSYIRPHRHLETEKDETIVCLRGRLGAVEFDDAGQVVETAVLDQSVPAVNLRHGTYHSLVSLEQGSVFLEAKAGPYRAMGSWEFAPWAPEEGSDAVAAWLDQLVRRLFA